MYPSKVVMGEGIQAIQMLSHYSVGNQATLRLRGYFLPQNYHWQDRTIGSSCPESVLFLTDYDVQLVGRDDDDSGRPLSSSPTAAPSNNESAFLPSFPLPASLSASSEA